MIRKKLMKWEIEWKRKYKIIQETVSNKTQITDEGKRDRT